MVKEPIELAKHVDPNKLGHSEYFDHLLAFNQLFQEKVVGVISSRFHNFMDISCSNFCIATTGSDARLEKGPKSLVEVVLFVEDFDDCDRVIQTMDSYVSTKPGIKIFDNEVEVKDIDQEKLSETTFHKGTPQEFGIKSPNRVFDARYLFGDDHIFKKAKRKLSKELKSPYGKRVLESIKKKAKEQQRIILKGTQRYRGEEVAHYDLKDGRAFYDPNKGIWSFKQGPLRAVQFALVRDMIRGLREGQDMEDIVYLPQNTVAKMNALGVQDHTLLSPENVGELCDHYKYFLQAYHKSQEHYSNEGKTELEFNEINKREIRNRARSLDKLLTAQKLRG
ncbi:MAG: hypothetical protein QGF74_03460 [Candidatus Nanoarchaeia archaeon]|jgi:hypothetical protein|nr:hypothetical protein [Candidatus Nanoarchaeia archaeon]|tara:strand:- start:45663 stop:46670 length:1008 start_codon:yes stop_codon:yes gene_type:complete